MLEQIRQFIREVKVEMKKVSWPTRDELTGSTTVVFITVTVVSLYIFAVDVGVSWLFERATMGISRIWTILGG